MSLDILEEMLAAPDPNADPLERLVMEEDARERREAARRRLSALHELASAAQRRAVAERAASELVEPGGVATLDHMGECAARRGEACDCQPAASMVREKGTQTGKDAVALHRLRRAAR